MHPSLSPELAPRPVSRGGIGAAELQLLLTELAAEFKFELAGAAPAVLWPELEYFPEWLDEGRGGEMAYLQRRNDHSELMRGSLQAAWPWARSVILCAAVYDSAAPLSIETAEEGAGWIARYAQPGAAEGGAADYHDYLLQRLRGMESSLHTRLEAACGNFQSRSYVDTGPLIERAFASHAGIGWTGKNTCTLHPALGSFFFLGAIVMSLELTAYDRLAAMLPDRCGTCTRCIDSCPTHALEPYKMDASRCISYLTIEKRGVIAEELRAGIGRNVFGCDICQDVCPWNAKARREKDWNGEGGQPVRAELVNPSLQWLASLDRSGFKKVFGGSPVERTKWRGLMRNVAIAMGNSGMAQYLPRLREWSDCADEPDLAEAAAWAITQIHGRSDERPAT